MPTQIIISKLISPRRKAPALLLVAFMLLGLSAMAFFADSVSAASYVANYVGATIRDTWVTVSTSGNVSIDLVRTPTGSLGVGKNEVTVKSNSSTGYRLYISAAEYESNLAHTAPLYKVDDKSKKILPLSNTSSPASFNSSEPNRWGYAVASAGTPETAGFSSSTLYEEAATLGTISSNRSDLTWKGMSGDYQVLVNSDTSSEDPGITTPVYYGVYVNSGALDSPELGTYRNTVVYTAFIDGGNTVYMNPSYVWDGDTVTIITEHQNSSAEPVTAEQIDFKLYNKDSAESNIATCDNITIDPAHDGSYGSSLQFSCTIHRGADAADHTPYDMLLRINAENKGIYITYAADDNWSFAKTLANITTMQEMTPEICAATPKFSESNTTHTLTDTRTSYSYLVRKLEDGNCWMIQNLALTNGLQINNSTSDYTSSTPYTIPSSDAAASVFNSGQDYTKGFVKGSHQNATVDNKTNNTGSWMMWNIATAGTGGAYGTSQTPTASVCPKGWKLPTSTQQSSLKTAYSSNRTNFMTAFLGTTSNDALVGRYSNSSFGDSGSFVLWWSYSQINSSYADGLYVDASYVRTVNDGKYSGCSVRCVLAP